MESEKSLKNISASCKHHGIINNTDTDTVTEIKKFTFYVQL